MFTEEGSFGHLPTGTAVTALLESQNINKRTNAVCGQNI
jgi:hypothetical protein